MPRLEIDITVTSISALSVGAGGSAGSLADKSIVRDGWGRPIIPGSQLKGKLRHAAERLLNSVGQPVPNGFDDPQTNSLIHTLFGAGGGDRAPLRFRDLVCVRTKGIKAEHLSQIRPSVSINRRRGTAEDARLFFQEAAHEDLVYRAAPAIAGELEQLGHAALLWGALRFTERWGGGGSRGLGWMESTITLRWDGTEQNETQLESALRTVLNQKGEA
ncbi:hypothetical protein OSCT_2391 [Oscillochloris trichoides DG-6]|uniref:CRISPR type III-associated protein domain-containing protein n=1 Tax=Oscillochloris trichoides DG-6 TaxID=765420 RepID=E1IGE0_9CHLR|nr:RAMP superfamily CRISPR-associated protein [Oscillochloris trichoides]EFO79706.1 hypothetical protein OSCT_2391 [Oscillochloris trichoides DG-6]